MEILTVTNFSRNLKFIDVSDGRINMSRLVIPQSDIGDQTHAEGPSGDGYLDRVAKYIPAEIVAAFLACQTLIIGQTKEESPGRQFAFIITTGILTALIPFYLRTISRNDLPWVKHAVLSAASFLVWVYALAETPKAFGVYSALVAGLSLIFVSLIAGMFQPTEGEK